MSFDRKPSTFACRRLGHANLAVSRTDLSASFYQDVIGLAFVFQVNRGPQLFFSNGNSHHDIAISPAKDVSDGLVNDGRWRPVRRTPGVNHLGFELLNQVDMSRAYENALNKGATLLTVMNHQISWGVYLADPEDNQVELYSDLLPDWRSFFSGHMGEGIGSLSAPPSSADADPSPIHGPYGMSTRTEMAAIRTGRLATASLRARDVELLAEFYCQVAGLEIRKEEADGTVSLGGSAGGVDLTIEPSRPSNSLGVFRLTFELVEGETLSDALEQLENLGRQPDVVDDNRGSFLIRDPDGMEIELREASEHS